MLKNSKINNVTVKRENGKYYAIVNITTTVKELEKTGKHIGIDLGLKNLATLSTGQEIVNLDLTHEEEMIHKYQRKLNRQKYMSNIFTVLLSKVDIPCADTKLLQSCWTARPKDYSLPGFFVHGIL